MSSLKVINITITYNPYTKFQFEFDNTKLFFDLNQTQADAIYNLISTATDTVEKLNEAYNETDYI